MNVTGATLSAAVDALTIARTGLEEDLHEAETRVEALETDLSTALTDRADLRRRLHRIREALRECSGEIAVDVRRGVPVTLDGSQR